MLTNYTKDKGAYHLARCAQEFQREINKAFEGFLNINLLGDLLEEPIPPSTAASALEYLTCTLKYYTPFWQTKNIEKKDYDHLFEHTKAFIKASKPLVDSISTIVFFNTENETNITSLEVFVKKLHELIFFYLASIKEAPALYTHFIELAPLHKEHLLKESKALNISLAGLHGGILPHLFQHLGRIPLTIRDMLKHASSSELEQIQALAECLRTIHEGTRHLVKIIQGDLPAVSSKQLHDKI